MKGLSYGIAGACLCVGVLCLFSGSPVVGGLNLFLAVLNYRNAQVIDG